MIERIGGLKKTEYQICSDIIRHPKPNSFDSLSILISQSIDDNVNISIAASVPNSDKYCLLASSNEIISTVVELVDKRILFSFDLSKFSMTNLAIGQRIVVYSDPAFLTQVGEDLKSLVKILMDDILVNRKDDIRNLIVEISSRSNDLNSLCYRIVHNIIIPYFKVEAASIYLIDPRNNFLRLSSSTGIHSELEKKDIFYEPTRQCRLLSSFNKRMPTCYAGVNLSDSDIFREQTKSSTAYSIYYQPVQRMHQNLKKHDRTYGVIKLVNPHKVCLGDSVSAFHCVDQIELSFLGELVSVLSQNYVRALEAENSFERTIHGFRADLESSEDHFDTLRQILFEDQGGGPILDYSNSVFNEQDIVQLFEHSIAFMEDLSFQIEKSRKLAHERDEVIDLFHKDVLVPLLNMQPSIMIANSSNSVNINNFVEYGSLAIPPIIGSRSGFISVFRNLFENSIKYSMPNQNPKIEVSFDDRGDYFEVSFRDYGIGIDKKDEKYLFVEGFRSIRARRRTFRGAGIGLTYSQEVMQFLGGELVYERVSPGMKFVVKMLKARKT